MGLGRLEERVRALRHDIEQSKRATTEALTLAANETGRRLRELNNEAGRLKEMHAITVTRELFDAKMGEVFSRLEKIEGNMREDRGRLWLPMLVVAGVAVALAAAVFKLIVK